LVGLHSLYYTHSIGFDFDYTLVTYTDELLELIYEKALARLVNDRQYPNEMLEAGLSYDPFFSIRGLAVDKETGKYYCIQDNQQDRTDTATIPPLANTRITMSHISSRFCLLLGDAYRYV